MSVHMELWYHPWGPLCFFFSLTLVVHPFSFTIDPFWLKLAWQQNLCQGVCQDPYLAGIASSCEPVRIFPSFYACNFHVFSWYVVESVLILLSLPWPYVNSEVLYFGIFYRNQLGLTSDRRSMIGTGCIVKVQTVSLFEPAHYTLIQ